MDVVRSDSSVSTVADGYGSVTAGLSRQAVDDSYHADMESCDLYAASTVSRRLAGVVVAVPSMSNSVLATVESVAVAARVGS